MLQANDSVESIGSGRAACLPAAGEFSEGWPCLDAKYCLWQMTDMSSQWVQFGLSVLAVTLLVMVTWALGFRQDAKLSSVEEARELFRLAPGGFEPASIALDTGRRAAFAYDSRGRMAVLRPHGNQFVFSEIDRGVNVHIKGDLLIVPGSPGLQIEIDHSAGSWTAADTIVSEA